MDTIKRTIVVADSVMSNGTNVAEKKKKNQLNKNEFFFCGIIRSEVF